MTIIDLKPTQVLLAVVLLAGALVAPALAQAAGCEYPQAPAVPNGETADEEQMREAQKSVRAYLASAEEYLACLSAMENDPENPLPERQAQINVARHNAAVDEMHRITDAYNVAVRTYKARQN